MILFLSIYILNFPGVLGQGVAWCRSEFLLNCDDPLMTFMTIFVNVHETIVDDFAAFASIFNFLTGT